MLVKEYRVSAVKIDGNENGIEFDWVDISYNPKTGKIRHAWFKKNGKVVISKYFLDDEDKEVFRQKWLQHENADLCWSVVRREV